MKRVALATAALALVAAGCAASAGVRSGGAVRLGYFANVTHATALAGTERGTFAANLGATRLETQVFNAGPAAIEAIFAGALDAAYVGPNPALNAHVKSKGRAVRIVAGATSGGAQLVVQPGITAPAQLRGKTLATPQLGNTQDVALRDWLQRTGGFETDAQGGGDVTVAPSDNATTLQLFKDRKVDGAWVPEPWASRLVIEGGGSVLVNEKDLWPDGRFTTTHLIVATKFLDKHPDVVKRLLEAHVETTAWINANADDAKDLVNRALEKYDQKRLPDDVLDRAWGELTITNDPLAPVLERSAKHAAAAGLIDMKGVVVGSVYDLRLLNEVLAATGGTPITADYTGAQ